MARRDWLDYRRLFEAVHPILLAQDQEIENLERTIRHQQDTIEKLSQEIVCLKVDLDRVKVRANA